MFSQVWQNSKYENVKSYAHFQIIGNSGDICGIYCGFLEIGFKNINEFFIEYIFRKQIITKWQKNFTKKIVPTPI
jgi:hypothetical protein